MRTFRICIRLYCLFVYVYLTFGDEFYDVLGISKHATDKEIRKAFKKKALLLHPDKNQDDPEAQSKFIKLNRAYEVLKDEELRKKYDIHGEEGLDDSKTRGNKYHSWSYYRDNFGIYDDDVEVITLNHADFEQSVLGSDDIWFINYYHPMCSHCHTLAPVWRKVAQELDGIVRIGAVNCDDAFHLCSSQGIRSYPSLFAYPGREHYRGDKSREDLINFVLRKLHPNPFATFLDKNWELLADRCDNSKPWIVVSKPQFEEEEDFVVTKIKLGAIFENLLCLGEVDCSKSSRICSALKFDKGARYFKTSKDLKSGNGVDLQNSNPQELAREVFNLLPDVAVLSSVQFSQVRRELETNNAVPWLVIFTDRNDDQNLELRKLPAFLPSFSLGRIECEEMKSECDELFISKTPAFVLFKMGGGYEMHQGRNLAHDIAVFARESVLATQFQILTPKEFPKVLTDDAPWFVDFYAPWCPPCMKLLPEFRKASRLLDIPVKFGSIDCTTHTSLCQKFNIHQYPTTILYNKTVPHQYHGYHSASQLIDFVKDTLNPTVIVLNENTFRERVQRKPVTELWVVDYYANWCGHCIEMAPEYRKFARLVAQVPNVFIAQIDCAIYGQVCRMEGVHGYPTIKLYPMGSSGTSSQTKYNGWSRDANSFKQWLYTMLPSKVATLNDRTFEEMLRSKEPWVVDFFAPWCGHCHQFAPEFESVATELEGEAKLGKVDCEAHKWLCRSAGVRAYPTVKLYIGIRQTERQRIDGQDLNSLDAEEIIYITRLSIKKHNKKRHDEL